MFVAWPYPSCATLPTRLGSLAIWQFSMDPMRSTSRKLSRRDTWVGRRMRVHATSVGKALVAHITEDRLEEILRKSGMEKRTPKTITTLPRLLKELEKVRSQGYAVDDEENNLGARCVGAPVFNDRGLIEAGLGLSGTAQQVSPQTMPRIVEALRDA